MQARKCLVAGLFYACELTRIFIFAKCKLNKTHFREQIYQCSKKSQLNFEKKTYKNILFPKLGVEVRKF